MENTTTENKNLYGITPESRKAAREKLERLIKEQNVKTAKTREELYLHSIKDDNGEEVNEFLLLYEESRNEKSRREFE